MITEQEVAHIAELADIGLSHDELREFTTQFNAILDYFAVLDQVPGGERLENTEFNIFRDDDVTASLTQDEALKNASGTEDGFFRAPRVM